MVTVVLAAVVTFASTSSSTTAKAVASTKGVVLARQYDERSEKEILKLMIKLPLLVVVLQKE